MSVDTPGVCVSTSSLPFPCCRISNSLDRAFNYDCLVVLEGANTAASASLGCLELVWPLLRRL